MSLLQCNHAAEASPIEAALKPPNATQVGTVNQTDAASNTQARVVNVDKSGVVRLQGDTIHAAIKSSGVAAVSANRFEGAIDQCGFVALSAHKAKVKGGTVGMLLAGEVELEDDAKVLFDLRAGLVAGALAGGILAIANSVWRVIGMRRNRVEQKEAT